MLLDLMTAIPPITHGTTMTSLEAVITFWVIIGVVVALAVVAMIVGVVSYRRVQRQSQMKVTERSYEASLQPQGGEQPPVQAPEEEKVLLRR
jgi:NADH:ubiquinone oxidoreductase subunit 3 (subunit A)